MEIKIGEKIIGRKHPCFIIAEAGVNHIQKNETEEQAYERACQMIEIAKSAGCDSIKFQTFKTEKLQLTNIPKPAYQNRNLGEQMDYFAVLKSLETSCATQRRIAEYCRRQKIIFLSTPYDNESADFLDELGVPAFKLASIETNNHLFLRYVAKKKKPVLLATGLSDLEQVRKAVAVFASENARDNLILLQCNSNYPTDHNDINLRVIKKYRTEFNLICGLSDHSPDDMASVGSVALGGRVVEKHFTLDKNFPGPDHSSSLAPNELKQWVASVREIETFIRANDYGAGEDLLSSFVLYSNNIDRIEMKKCLGSSKKKTTISEIENKQMKKFLVIKPAAAGSKINIGHLAAMRTGGDGVLATDENLNKIINATLRLDIDKPVGFDWNMLS
ncbi:MAG: N-acetylneuraminate synthase family protein [Parcubacteria group bacterium]